MFVVIGICISLGFAFLFACVYVTVQSHHPKAIFGTIAIAVAGTLLHILIAKQNGWDVIFPANGKGMALEIYYLDVFLWGSILWYLVMRKFPMQAKRILNAAIGSK